MAVQEGAPAETLVETAEAAPKLTPVQLEHIDTHFDLVEVVAAKVVGRKEFKEATGDGYVALVEAAIEFDTDKASEQANNHSGYYFKCIKGGILKGLRTRLGRSENGGIANKKPGVMSGIASSLEAPVGDMNETMLVEIVPEPTAQQAFELSNLRMDVEGALKGVDEKKREIFMRAIFSGEEQTAIAKDYGLQRYRVSQIKNELSEPLRDKLADYREAA